MNFLEKISAISANLVVIIEATALLHAAIPQQRDYTTKIYNKSFSFVPAASPWLKIITNRTGNIQRLKSGHSIQLEVWLHHRIQISDNKTVK